MVDRDPQDLTIPLRGATFGEAVKRFFRSYFRYSGRASKSEFWWPALANLLAILVAVGVIVTGGVLGEEGAGSPVMAIGGMLIVAIMIVYGIGGISLSVRRLHDIDQSGWWYLLIVVAAAVPVVNIAATIAALAIGLIEAKPGGVRYDAPRAQRDRLFS
ncbi:DUF805 domain-containing protein [Tsukamurella pseudospumae]|uniref:DUF805 domain-containing protein n=1 Tax=Tsukamurella pseudospumae TaxID=239498 RepID=UPI0018D3BF7C|nr:DUF805 domain-containing protein [Tsukamurella pseudospumae]